MPEALPPLHHIIRFLANGKSELTFGNNGVIIIDDGADEQLNDAVCLNNGHIMAVGKKKRIGHPN